MILSVQNGETTRSAIYVRKRHEFPKGGGVLMDQSGEAATSSTGDADVPSGNIVMLADVDFAYRKPRVEVFRNFNLTLAAGMVTCLLGHNGAGKTTLLKLIYGDLRRQAGRIAIDGDRVSRYSGVFLLVDRFGVSQELSMRQNVIFRCKLLGKDADSVLSHPLFEEFKLAKHMDKPVKALSAGYFMRANMAAGLAFEPALLLLDEPTNSVDPATRELLSQALRQQVEIGSSVILVTHDLGFAYSVGDRLIVLDDGVVVVDDSHPRGASLDDFTREYIRHTEQTG